MRYEDCPHVQDIHHLGDSRVHMEQLGKVLAEKYRQRFSGVPLFEPEPLAAPRARWFNWARRLLPA